ncbi:HAUS augmin-like complex subunit 4-domain-containing protein [Gilbertella persicaria]|uniref:HAUS augmin-like complex subunit 4-domain-containing protein n=1 Tax=Gilbertella persicaria TaxID=101096 RepID=UPI00221FAB1D|nr:HAUS augmin-like complex subunit 4-domain-containing protein [Gilbertella persicaria]KAI8098095.1 HAUS augmin-like complex subunit 4-domain-containing protein [Gilbertella persicaria]
MTNIQQEQVEHFKNKILLTELKKFEYDINTSSIPVQALVKEAIQLKHKKVKEFMSASSITSVQDIKQQIKQDEQDLVDKRALVESKVVYYVKTVLNILDVTWSVIEQFKYKAEKDKNIQFDNYYTSLVDTLLIKVKILHTSVLMNTYQGQEFITALESLKNLLEDRYMEAQTTLEYITKQLTEYNDIGPEFKTLSTAYHGLLYKIQAAKDDIERMKRN